MLQKFICFLCILISFSSIAQSKIEKAEESLKQKENKSNIATQNSTSTNNNDETLGEALVKETFGGLAASIFFYSAYGILIEMPFEKNSPSNNAILTKQPYKDASNGNYSYDWNANSAVGRTTISSRYIFENSVVDGHHLNIDLRFYNKMALEVDYLQLWENNPNFGNYALAVYTFLLKYHRIRTKRFDAWWGLGASYIDGNVDDSGFTAGLGAEAFIGKPISLESNINLTAISGNSVKKFNALLNYYLNQFKINGGYERLKIGSQRFSTASIGGSISF